MIVFLIKPEDIPFVLDKFNSFDKNRHCGSAKGFAKFIVHFGFSSSQDMVLC